MEDAYLNTSELLYQNIIDSLPEGILFCDRDFIVRKVNSCYAALLGSDVQSILGRPLPDLNPVTRAKVVINSGKPEMGDLCTLPLFGDNYRFVVNRIPVRDSSGEVCGMLSHIQFTHPAELQELTKKIEFLSKKLKSYHKSLKSEHQAHYDITSIIGDSEPMKAIKKLIQNYAADIHPVLIQGNTGTGKELAAHALHAHSSSPGSPFISINCAAIPKELFETELFGYVSGAFSSANREGKPGKMELANGGTLFLDEIGEMPISAQVKLLRVLEDKCITRLGAVTPRHVNFRLITATNRNLQEMIAKNSFREDLYYRISTLVITMPALRSRREDILPLACNILRKINSKITDFCEEARSILENYSWPGNVRQLFNVLVQASIHAGNNCITAADLPAELKIKNIPERYAADITPKNLEEWMNMQEADFIKTALQRNAGNVSAAARQMGISRVTLYAKIKKHALMNLLG